MSQAPGLGVVSEGAAAFAFAFDALIGHSDVPVSLGLNLPCVGTGGEALSGEDLWGFVEAGCPAGVIQLALHSLCCLLVGGESKERTGSVQV